MPDLGWEEVAKSKSIIQWINPEKTISISINYFDKKPDLPLLKDMKVVRSFFRGQILEQNGGLIQVDLTNLDKYQGIKTIFKMPQEPSGIVYLASLTIPFKDCSYVVKIQAPEMENIGIRDSVIEDRLKTNGRIVNENQSYQQLSVDPYLETFTKGTLMTKAEDVLYDIEFKDHPLTVARKLLAEIETKITFKPELEKLKKY